MKHLTQFKILACIISILIIVTAILSLYFALYPIFHLNDAPQIILNILLVMNVLIPTLGIATMIAFIHFKNKKT
jgi:mannose/fructose/N-acetylgalactosamine-specific phosphotransferase system component IIC